MKNLQELSEPPIFIVGVPRSGTTLLRLMLASHPDICIPPESTFFAQLESKYGHLKNLADCTDNFAEEIYQNEKFKDWKIAPVILKRNLSLFENLSYSEAVATVYQTYLLAAKPTAKIWGDKNPEYINQIDKIIKYFPNSKIIHIIRDVRALYSSFKQVRKFSTWTINNPAKLATDMWSQAAKIFQDYRDGCQFYHIYYEDLVAKPEDALQKLCSWLGIDFRDSMLMFYNNNAINKLVPQHRLAWHQNTLKPASIERIDAWKNELSIFEIKKIEKINKENMKILGYRNLPFLDMVKKQILLI